MDRSSLAPSLLVFTWEGLTVNLESSRAGAYVLAVGTGGGCLDIFSQLSFLFYATEGTSGGIL